MSFVHLHVHSSFSFLDGAASPGELAQEAVRCGMEALALTDHDTLAGAVEFTLAAREAGLRPLLGAEVTLEGDGHLVLLARDRQGWENLCRLVSQTHLESERLSPRVKWEDLARRGDGLLVLSGCRRGPVPSYLLQGRAREAEEWARACRSRFRRSFLLELEGVPRPGSGALNRALARLARRLDLPLVASANVHYARRRQFPVHDVLTCVRTGTTLQDVHPERPLGSDQYLCGPGDMRRRLPGYPRALERTAEVARECQDVLSLGGKFFPAFPLPPGAPDAPEFLRQETYRGARRRYGRITAPVRERLDKELHIITALGYSDYFLLVWDLVRFARGQGIRHAGRGSAADSLVAYCLDLTQVDSLERGLLFERFLSLERQQRPDIDLDFDSRYRDRMARYLVEKYGEERVAGVATYSTFRARSAVRALGQALGFSREELDGLARRLPPCLPADAIAGAGKRLPELRDSSLSLERYQRLFDLCAAVAGFPRFLGTHLGGLVVAHRPLSGLVPLTRAAKGIVVTQFDKDHVEEAGLVKLDLLSLRTLAAVEDTLQGLEQEGKPLVLEELPTDDAATYARLRRGDTIGIFQLESPAQRALQSRLGAEQLEDVVASVALIRPGPIQGNMVEPYIARRLGQERVEYLHPGLKPILEKTYGVILFQEQVIEIAITLAGLSPGEADLLRRTMTRARTREELDSFRHLFVEKARQRGVEEDMARRIFSTLEGYAGYGFCEAHAASFGLTAYYTAYLLEHYPAHYYAALLSHQPLGYYPPRLLCDEARRRGINILPPDVHCSREHFSVEGGNIRVSLPQIRDLGEEEARSLIRNREERPYASWRDLCRRAGVGVKGLEGLVLSGAMDDLASGTGPAGERGVNRRALLQAVRQWGQAAEPGPLWDEAADPARLEAAPDFTPEEKRSREFSVLGLHLDRHPLQAHRPELERQGLLTAARARAAPAGSVITAAGLAFRPHRPPTRSGRIVVFFSLEDETGLLEVTVFEDLYQRRGQFLFGPERPLLAVRGTLERRGQGASLTARDLWPWSPPARPGPASPGQS